MAVGVEQAHRLGVRVMRKEVKYHATVPASRTGKLVRQSLEALSSEAAVHSAFAREFRMVQKSAGPPASAA